MALSYYLDPRSGRRTTRDHLVHLRDLASGRWERWAEVVGEFRGKIEDATHRQITSGWRTRWQGELVRASRYLNRARSESEAFDEAIKEGDGRGKTWRYRLSFSYLERKKKRDTLMVDVLMRKSRGERASKHEARAAFYQYLREEEPPPGWHVEQVAWQHELRTTKGTRASEKRSVSSTEQVALHIGTIFRKVLGEDTEEPVQEIETEDTSAPRAAKRAKGSRGRRRGHRNFGDWAVVGEEEEGE